METIAIEGTRNLPHNGAALVGRVTATLLREGKSIVTGCCRGSDAAVITSALANGYAPRLSVFAAFGPDAGCYAIAAYHEVLAALRAGSVIHYWAGGSFDVPLRARLARRSELIVKSAHGLVAFVAGPCPSSCAPSRTWRGNGSGTWGSVALAAGLGLPVIVFPVSDSPLPSWPRGSWVALGSKTYGSPRFAWSPMALPLG